MEVLHPSLMDTTPQMTPEKALELLNELRLKFEMSGANHMLALQAYETLRAYLADHQQKP